MSAWNRSLPASLVAALAFAACVGCKDSSSGAGAPPASSTPPPQSATAKAGACAGGGGEDTDAVSAPVFPRTVKVASGDYCLEPGGQVRTFGDRGQLTLEEVCTTQVDGECEVYKHFGLKRFVALRYVDGSGAGGSVEVYLSQYGDAAGAYGMYTKRVIADGDPAAPSAPKFIDAGGAGAIGTGRAYVWRGDQVAELQYINESESLQQLSASSLAVLTPLAKAIGAGIPGALDKPPSAAALPTAHLVNPSAISYLAKDALGVPGIGAGAVGYCKEGAERYRLVAIEKADADQARDAMKTLRGTAGAIPVPPVRGADEAVHVVLQSSPEAPKVEWLFARKGALVAGAGDEESLLRAGDSVRLPKDEAIAKLEAWLAGPAPAAAAASASPLRK